MTTPSQDDEARLDPTITASRYDLTIRTDLEAHTQAGAGVLTLHLANPSKSITLHSASPLRILSASIPEGPGLASKVVVDKKLERATLHFGSGDEDVLQGEVKVALRWEAVLDKSMMGYYASSYPVEGKEGVEAIYALTQFEPTMARRAFPCLDEPDKKAVFNISLISRVGTVSLSNTPVTSTQELPSPSIPPSGLLTTSFLDSTVPVTGLEDEVPLPASLPLNPASDKWEITTFAPTPKMSTYLVAFANGPFKSISGGYTSALSGRKVDMKVYATWDHIKQTALTLETSEKVVPIYEKMFDVEYPLPKLDTLVASDFDAGAMENWGLITGRTSIYLFDEEKSGLASRKRLVGVQSHEIAHQWFGNVVTMQWWDNLWLNEAFATLVGEVIMINEIHPEWKCSSTFISEHLARAFSFDALRSSHPIEVPCPNEDFINQIFDAISYSKGASVLKMLANMVGQDKFLKGVSLYLKKHLYGNARTEDLWKGITEASGVDVGTIMHNWVQKVGFPVVTVEETTEGIKVRQNRFLATGDPTPEEDETIWHIPLELLTLDKSKKSKINHEAVLSTRETTIPIANVGSAVYKLNANTAGVYRVLYPSERLSKLADTAVEASSPLSLDDRMGLVQDAAVLASSGYSRTSTALTLIAKLGSVEKENLVWDEITSAIGSIATVWWEQPQEVRDAINALRKELFRPVVERLGWEYKKDEDVDTIELRTTAIGQLATAGDEATLNEYKKRFKLLMDNNDESSIPNDLRQSIFTKSVKNGGAKEYEKILQIYRAPPTPGHKLDAIAALCATEDPELLERTFEFIFTDVREQDIMYFFRHLSVNAKSRRKLWTFFQQRFDEFAARYKGNFNSFRALVEESFKRLTSEEDATDVEKFFAGKETSGYSQALGQGLGSIRSNAAWLQRDALDVSEWLKTRSYLA